MGRPAQAPTSWLSFDRKMSSNQLSESIEDLVSGTIHVPHQDEQRWKSNSGIIPIEGGRKKERKRTAEECR